MWNLYLDESGDLGLDFELKKPSGFLTIAILATNQRETVTAIRSAVRKTLHRKVNRRKKTTNELKGSRTTIAVKRYFYQQIERFEFGIYAITLDKRSAHEQVGRNAGTKERLYNFIAHEVLKAIPLEDAGGAVELVVDKSKGKRQVADFNTSIRFQLESRLDPRIKLSIFHRNSCDDSGLSAIDLFCWGIARRHERADDEWYNDFREKIRLDHRYP
ncbi:MAG TPA: DUF3800 domain-containing protein [Pirellulales bacterium]|jgi:hypothetical protein